MDHAAIADKLIALINSKPWSPRRDDIVAILAEATPAPKFEPLPIQVFPSPSPGIPASVYLKDSSVMVTGWMVAAHRGAPASPAMIKLAVLEYCRQQVLKEVS